MEGGSLEWMKFRSTRHTRYWCGYHFVWIPNYRRDVLVGEVAEYIKGVLEGILGELGCEPLAVRGDARPCPCFRSMSSKTLPTYVVNY